MRLERAEQILKSPNNIEVLYLDSPVWIDNIDNGKGTASIRRLDTNETLEVPVRVLNETGNAD